MIIRYSFFAALLLMIAGTGWADPAIRPNSLVFNQIVTLNQGEAPFVAPLYLSRRGEYFAEVYLEHTNGERVELPAAGLSLQVDIRKGERSLFQRDVNMQLGTERPISTLFRFTSDREIPLRKQVQVYVSVSGELTQTTAAGAHQLRLQIKRKPNRVRWL